MQALSRRLTGAPTRNRVRRGTGAVGSGSSTGEVALVLLGEVQLEDGMEPVEHPLERSARSSGRGRRVDPRRRSRAEGQAPGGRSPRLLAHRAGRVRRRAPGEHQGNTAPLGPPRGAASTRKWWAARTDSERFGRQGAVPRRSAAMRSRSRSGRRVRCSPLNCWTSASSPASTAVPQRGGAAPAGRSRSRTRRWPPAGALPRWAAGARRRRRPWREDRSMPTTTL